MPLSLIHLPQIRIFTNGFDALLQRDNFVVTSHHHHCPKLKTLREMHGTDGDEATRGFNVIVKNPEQQSRFLDSATRPRDLGGGSDEHANLM